MSSNTSLGGPRSSGTGVDARSVALGAGAGAVAFVVSYFVTFLLWTQTTLPEPDSFGEAFQQLFVRAIRDNVPSWKVAGMTLYNAHFVDLTFTGPFGSSSVDLIDLAGGGLVSFAVVVPPVLLLLAGFATASLGDVTADLPNAVAAGALTLVGYLVLALVGTVLFAYHGDGDLTIPLVPTVVFLGVVYPVVFGGLGGAGAYLLER